MAEGLGGGVGAALSRLFPRACPPGARWPLSPAGRARAAVPPPCPPPTRPSALLPRVRPVGGRPGPRLAGPVAAGAGHTAGAGARVRDLREVSVASGSLGWRPAPRPASRASAARVPRSPSFSRCSREHRPAFGRAASAAPGTPRAQAPGRHPGAPPPSFLPWGAGAGCSEARRRVPHTRPHCFPSCPDPTLRILRDVPLGPCPHPAGSRPGTGHQGLSRPPLLQPGPLSKARAQPSG